MVEKVSIIGAGIGGLTTALILKQKGINFTVFESAASIEPIGAGIIIANNAMQVFQKLGIHGKIEKFGNKISCMKITDPQLNPISIADLTPYEKKYGVHNIAIHRGELQKIIIDTIGSENINTSKRLSKIEKKEVFQLTFDDNSTFKTELVIGADGIKSTVREQLFEQSIIRNAKQICWRGICEMDLPKKYHNELNEAWGKGKRFGFVKISSKKVYWYALVNTKKNKIETVNLKELFEDFHCDILNIIAATPQPTIRTSEITDLKPINKWHDKNVCLIGDAAHATTPNLGQGACQAIEDAYVLGRLLDSGIPLENTFQHYEKLRRKKAHAIVKTSWVVGKMAHIENDFGIWLRNLILKKLSKSSNKKQMDKIFQLN